MNKLKNKVLAVLLTTLSLGALTACSSKNINTNLDNQSSSSRSEISSTTSSKTETNSTETTSSEASSNTINSQTTCYSAKEMDSEKLKSFGGSLHVYEDDFYLEKQDILTLSKGIKIEINELRWEDNTETLEKNYFHAIPAAEPDQEDDNALIAETHDVLLVSMSISNDTDEEQAIYLNTFFLVAYPKEGENWVWEREAMYRSNLEEAFPDNHAYARLELQPGESWNGEVGFFVPIEVREYTPLYLTYRDANIDFEDNKSSIHDWYIKIV